MDMKLNSVIEKENRNKKMEYRLTLFLHHLYLICMILYICIHLNKYIQRQNVQSIFLRL